MGVIRADYKTVTKSEVLDEMFEIIAEQEIVMATAEVIQADMELARVAADNVRRQTRGQERKLRKKTSCRPEPTFRGLGCRGKGHRKHRRYENSNLLAQSLNLNLLGEDMDCDIDIYDFVPRSMSVFAQLLAEKETMQAWTDFIGASEDEQQAILMGLSEEEDEDGWVSMGKADHLRRRGRRGPQRKQRANSDGDEDDEAGRKVHPAFCPGAAFERLDADMKSLLRRKNIPKGVLAALEQELVEFFSADPRAKYLALRKDGLERLCLHATSQWMNLNCQSFNRKDGRWSRVVTKRHDQPFVAPSINLASFLEKMSL